MSDSKKKKKMEMFFFFYVLPPEEKGLTTQPGFELWFHWKISIYKQKYWHFIS